MENLEKLILNVTITDNFTYWIESHIPILYSSKEKAIEDLDILIHDYSLKIIELEEKKSNIELVKPSKNSYQFPKLYMEYLKNLQSVEKEIKKLYNFDFGGAQLSLDFFIDSENQLIKPNIITIDEFFQHNYKNLNMNQSINKKLKI
jgi:hypothetical protein